MAYVVEQFLFDFSDPAAIAGWRPVDDVVMGGCSRSRVEQGDGVLVFTGELSLQRGGGFASIRSPSFSADLSSGTSLVLRGRGDGHSYKLGLRLSEGFDAPVYQARFQPLKDGFGEIVIPFAELQPHYHGRLLPGANPFNPERVCSVGVLISERQAGPFRLELQSISWR